MHDEAAAEEPHSRAEHNHADREVPDHRDDPELRDAAVFVSVREPHLFVFVLLHQPPLRQQRKNVGLPPQLQRQVQRRLVLYFFVLDPHHRHHCRIRKRIRLEQHRKNLLRFRHLPRNRHLFILDRNAQRHHRQFKKKKRRVG